LNALITAATSQSAIDIYIKEADILPSSSVAAEATGNLDTGSFDQGVRPE